ncbi:MAG: D-2-hydroxyacid dehydrogenase [Steroidobacteraceae bacterium]
MQAVFLDYDTVSNGDLDTSVLIRAAGAVRFCAATADSQIIERIGDADIVLLNKAKLSGVHLHAARRLKLIALAATGTDNVDLIVAKDRGIAVCNVRGYCTRSVVQHAWAMILSLTQHLSEYSRLATDGSWVRREESAVLAYPVRELAGRTLGVVGWGELGRAVAKAAEAFGMRVIISNRPGAAVQPGRMELAQLLATADVISLHCPLTPSSRGLIGARELELMKPDAVLINTARGALVDGQALARALKERRLAGAGIDVLPQEPPIDGDPLLDPSIPNLILTPHMAWAAREARQRCLEEMAANIEDFLRGGRRGRVV